MWGNYNYGPVVTGEKIKVSTYTLTPTTITLVSGEDVIKVNGSNFTVELDSIWTLAPNYSGIAWGSVGLAPIINKGPLTLSIDSIYDASSSNSQINIFY